MGTLKFGLAWSGILSLWLALRVVYWNGYYTEDAPGYVTDAVWTVLGNLHPRDHVNGLNVGTYLPVALPIWLLGKSEVALGLWPLACSLLGLLSVAGSARLLFGRPAALLAAFLYATHPGDVFFSTVVMPDALQAGWLSVSIFLVIAASVSARSSHALILACAGVAMGICHLIRANDALVLPAGVFAAVLCARVLRGARWMTAVTDAVTYLAGWALVIAAEGLAYLLAAGDFLHRFRIIDRHYGTPDSIARAGLNTDASTIPFSVFAPAMWLVRGGWGQLNQDQAYHGLLFSWAVLLLIVGVVVARRTRAVPSAARAGVAIGAVWMLWPLLYHQFGSQSVTDFVPIHRLSRHLVVYAPGAMFATVAGAVVLDTALRAAGKAHVRRVAVSMGVVALGIHAGLNWKGAQVSFESFHGIKDTYVRIREHLPPGTRTIVGDPGDLCFLDFWMNPLGVQTVRMVPFAAYDRCDLIQDGIVLTHANPGWFGGAPIIRDTVRRLPCLIDPPPTWELVYGGYPEKVFRIVERRGDATK